MYPYNDFAEDLFSAIVANKSSKNVVYSPALGFTGDKRQTTEEMRKVLKLSEGVKTRFWKIMHNFWKILFSVIIYLLHYQLTRSYVIPRIESYSCNGFAADLFPVTVANKTAENVAYSPALQQTRLAYVLGDAESHTAEEMRKVLKLSKVETEMSSHNAFASDLFSVIVTNKSTENVVYSPASIETCLALVFGGAEGQTAEEMHEVLKLPEGDKKQVLANYKEFLENSFKSSKSSEDAPQLKMANRLYVNSQLKIAAQFNTIAQDYFNAQAENVDFSKNQEVVQNINQWVEQQTENKIKNLLEKDAVNDDTTAVLVNAIYFNAKWLYPFPEEGTKKTPFYLNNNQQIEVDMMHTRDNFGYLKLPKLDATALEMPYKDSDISMLIILPNDKEGLEMLETKLKGYDLNQITSNMMQREIDVYLPKFRIEYDIDLEEPLRKLGLNSIFDEKADFSGLFESNLPQQISKAKHKAYLVVNETGSVAAAATYIGVQARTSFLEFCADHPFVFAIRNKVAVFFTGHVAKF